MRTGTVGGVGHANCSAEEMVWGLVVATCENFKTTKECYFPAQAQHSASSILGNQHNQDHHHSSNYDEHG